MGHCCATLTAVKLGERLFEAVPISLPLLIGRRFQFGAGQRVEDVETA
jgi:hypothetical protein